MASWLDFARSLFGAAPRNEREQTYGSPIRALAEPAAAALTGMVAAPAAGLHGLATLAGGGSLEGAVANIESTQRDATYAPRTTRGKAGLAALGSVLEPISQALEAPGKAAGAAGFPLTGAALTAAAETFSPGKKIGRKYIENDPDMPTIEVWHGSPHTFLEAVLVKNHETDKSHIMNRSEYLRLKELGDTRWSKVKDLPLGAFQKKYINTGEGAQVYGSGTAYFGSQVETAKHYQEVLSRGDGKILSQEGFPVNSDDVLPRSPYMDTAAASSIEADARARAFSTIRDAAMDKKAALTKLDTVRQHYRPIEREDKVFARAAELIRGVDVDKFKYLPPDPGSLYKAKIPHESKHLDWDARLVNQPTDVRIALEKLGYKPSRQEDLDVARSDWESRNKKANFMLEHHDKAQDHLRRAEKQPSKQVYDAALKAAEHAEKNYRTADMDARISGHKWQEMQDTGELTGRDIYKDLTRKHGHPMEASSALDNAGIPGLTYKGGTSGARNFVVFDDLMVHILEKGSMDPKLLALLAGGSAIAAGAARDDEK